MDHSVESARIKDSLDKASMETLIADLWRGRWVVVASLVFCLLFALIFLGRATYVHTAELKILPAEREVGGETENKLGGLAAVVSLAVPGDSGSRTFTLYKQMLTSRELAESLARDRALMRHLFASEWDSAANRWVAPDGALSGFASGVKHFLGLPVYKWTAPDAARVQAFLQSRIEVNEDPKSPIVKVNFSDPDPEFAVAFLGKLHDAADQAVRQRALHKSQEDIRYLSEQLRAVTLAEHRSVLSSMLGARERDRMLAESSASFAAEPVDTITASSLPTSPRPTVVLIGAALGGVLVGILLVLACSRFFPTWRWRRQLKLAE